MRPGTRASSARARARPPTADGDGLDAHIEALRELVELKLALMPPAAALDRPELIRRLGALLGRFGL
jgi:hypothetical protein